MIDALYRWLVQFIHTWAATSWSNSRIHPSWPRPRVSLSLLSTPLHFASSLFVLAHPVACCLSQLFIFHMCTLPYNRTAYHCYASKQYGYATSHAQQTCTYIHHIIITIQCLLHTSSTFLGRPAGPDHSCREQEGYNERTPSFPISKKNRTCRENIRVEQDCRFRVGLKHKGMKIGM
jgi:hypothetical protein